MQAELLFETLKVGSVPLWAAAQDHPFVDALGDGSLERDRFAYYLKQDYLYLIGYSRAISLAAARSPSLQLLTEFNALAHETLSAEMALHREYCAQFGITEAELEQAEASPVCRAYSDFCISTAAGSDCIALLAALIPCGVGYAEIGQRLLAGTKSNSDHPYCQWIETYTGQDYRVYADWMVATLDRLGSELPASRLSELQQLFNTGCRYEWLFWEMAWTKQQWPL